ncbi:MAG: MetQ/NlpA family ABC transporter substrate-binding protein [Bulleidia sp.]
MKNYRKTFTAFLALSLLAGCGTASTSSTTSDSAEPVKIGIPSDATNGARGLLVLESAGLIEVDDAAGFTPELKDVSKYIYNIEIVPTQANTLVSTLDDFGASTINGTYAVPAGLNPKTDGLITEVQDPGSDNPFINVIVARTSEKDNSDYQTIVKAYQTQTVAQYIIEKNKGASIPAFDYDPDYTVDENYVSDLEGYQSSPDGKKVIRLGVCGSGDVWRAVQKVLDEENSGLYIDVIVFDAYNLPNEALNSGEIDLNAFQHVAYLNDEIASQGYDITPIGNTSSAPLTLYSKKYASLDELKTAAGLKQ